MAIEIPGEFPARNSRKSLQEFKTNDKKNFSIPRHSFRNATKRSKRKYKRNPGKINRKLHREIHIVLKKYCFRNS